MLDSVCWYLLQPLAEFLRLRPSDMGAMNARCQFLFVCERCVCRPLRACNSLTRLPFIEASARADATVQAAAARIFSGGGEQSSEVVRSVSAAAAEQEHAWAQAALEAAAGFESQARADDAELLQVNEAISEERRLSSTSRWPRLGVSMSSVPGLPVTSDESLFRNSFSS